MAFLKWLLIIVGAIVVFPFMVRTIGLAFTIVIAIILAALIIAASRQVTNQGTDIDVSNEKERPIAKDLSTEFAEDETFTDEQLQNLKDENRSK